MEKIGAYFIYIMTSINGTLYIGITNIHTKHVTLNLPVPFIYGYSGSIIAMSIALSYCHPELDSGSVNRKT